MTLVIDASAFVKRYLHEPGHDLVVQAMADDQLVDRDLRVFVVERRAHASIMPAD